MDDKALASWLTARLQGEQAKRDWRMLVEASWSHLLDTKLGVLFPPREVEALAAAYLTPERVLEVVRPAVVGVVPAIVREMRADQAKIGRWVPDEARRAMMALAGRKSLVHPSWIESVFREEAAEAILSDTLLTTLRDFSQIVPRILQNVSPLGKLAKLGGFGGDKSGIGSRLIEELEKRLEPEIRRFLDAGTRRALDGAAKFAVDHLDDARSITFRRNMVSFVLDQTGAFHAHPLTDDVLADVDHIARAIALHVAGSEEAKTRLADAVKRLNQAWGERTAREVLGELGVGTAPPLDAWAEATWPVVQAVLQAPGVTSWIEGLSREILEVVARG